MLDRLSTCGEHVRQQKSPTVSKTPGNRNHSFESRTISHNPSNFNFNQCFSEQAALHKGILDKHVNIRWNEPNHAGPISDADGKFLCWSSIYVC